MKVSSFEWDEQNLPPATRHGVSKEEIEEVIVGTYCVRKGRSGVYLAYGQTFDGRYILVIFQSKGHGVVRPFSARPMTHHEKRRVRRHQK